MTLKEYDAEFERPKTLQEALGDGVTIESKNKISLSNVNWLQKRQGKRIAARSVTVNRTCITLGAEVIQWLEDPAAVALGVGEYEGEQVLLITPDPKGLVIDRKTNSRAIRNNGTVGKLVEQGITLGSYSARRKTTNGKPIIICRRCEQ